MRNEPKHDLKRRRGTEICISKVAKSFEKLTRAINIYFRLKMNQNNNNNNKKCINWMKQTKLKKKKNNKEFLQFFFQIFSLCIFAVTFQVKMKYFTKFKLWKTRTLINHEHTHTHTHTHTCAYIQSTKVLGWISTTLNNFSYIYLLRKSFYRIRFRPAIELCNDLQFKSCIVWVYIELNEICGYVKLHTSYKFFINNKYILMNQMRTHMTLRLCVHIYLYAG